MAYKMSGKICDVCRIVLSTVGNYIAVIDKVDEEFHFCSYDCLAKFASNRIEVAPDERK